MLQRLEDFLLAHQARCQALEHPGAVTAQEQAAATRTPGRSFAKVMVVKERDGYLLAVLPASSVLDLDRLKGLVGHGDLRLATIEEIRSAVGDLPAGAIPPFGALFGLSTFVDRALLNTREVTMPAGDFATALRMRVGEFQRLAGARSGDFAVVESLVRAGGARIGRGTPRRPAGRRRRARA
jgi:Ala-tRNA(Pro) deacylase